MHHKVNLPDVGILIANTTQLFPLSNIESPAPGWTNQLISDILSLDGLGLQLTIISIPSKPLINSYLDSV